MVCGVNGARASKIDSLKSVAEQAKGAARARALSELGARLAASDPREGLKYAQQGLLLAQKLDSAFIVFQAAMNVGGIYAALGENGEALKHFQTARETDVHESRPRLAFTLYVNIGNIYLQKGEETRALKYFQDALNTEGGNSLYELAVLMENFGAALLELGRYEESLGYFRKAEAYSLQIGDAEGAAIAEQNLGKIHLKQNRLPEAIASLKKALAVFERIEHYSGVSETRQFIGDAYLRQQNFGMAETYYREAIRAAEQKGHIKGAYKGYEKLSELLARQRRHSEAFLALNKAAAYKDSFINSEKDRLTAEMEVRLGLVESAREIERLHEAREREIERMNKDRARDQAEKNLLRWLLAAAVFAGLLLVGGAIQLRRRYREKRRHNQSLARLNRQITLHRDEVQAQAMKITDSIEYARMIQETFLPDRREFGEHFDDTFVFFQPKDVVSGDFYWLNATREDVLLAAGDCTGHGVAGAFMSVMAYSALEHVVNNQGTRSPEQILGQAHDTVHRRLRDLPEVNDYLYGMDVSICRFYFRRRKLHYAGANNSVYIARDGELHILKADRQPIGGRQVKRVFEMKEFQLKPGDWVYMFSDGFADQLGGPRRRKFMYKQFRETCIEAAELSAAAQRELFVRTFAQWRGANKQVDDVLVVGVKVS